MFTNLHHDDCFKTMDGMDDNEVDVVFTSPPYNRERNDTYEHYDDTLDDYYEFLVETIDECIRVSSGYVILNLQKNYYNKHQVFEIIGEYSDEIEEVFIWSKSNPTPASGKSVTNAYEMFIFFSDDPIKANETYTLNVLETSVNTESPNSHNAVMKKEVADHFIGLFTEDDDVVFDPFMGVGTTGESCQKFGRDFVGCELKKEYFVLCEKNLGVRKCP